MSLYLSIRPTQPFADIESEVIEDEVKIVRADGQIVGIRLPETEMVLRLPELIERYEIPPHLVWARIRADDGIELGRRAFKR